MYVTKGNAVMVDYEKVRSNDSGAPELEMSRIIDLYCVLSLGC